MRVTYPGPYAAVHLPEFDVNVARGETVSVSDDIGAHLVEQGWIEQAAPEKKTPATTPTSKKETD